MILVTGATGNVGREVVEQLHSMGQRVRVLSRNPEKVQFPDSVEVVTGDLADMETVKPALTGVNKVFLIYISGGEEVPKLAKELGVEHIVFLSSGAIESAIENGIGRMHAEVEELIRQSGVTWTFLRPDAFMSNSLQWAESVRTEGMVRAPFGDVLSVPIDPKDIASVAVKALSSAGHDNEIYTLTGPEALNPEDQAHIIGDVLGKKVAFQSIPEEVARQYMTQHAPEEIVDALFKLMQGTRIKPQPVLDTVERITGKPARTYSQWVKDNAGAFR
ncbi:SDR family oxidoreductase [Alicyclobacillus sp. SO9]|uniref:SDR family oxidoreductase n=1 Tax=Alicyclobacillus sp. SO9 TaxID=2665646 RepID=UPI0018E8EF39|nr:SDR family oxidoreductase [Alicyclobacillus sp. SO9]QQE79767.1 SDR family oxidoreductase [Alicyclobacillus sp. SO9]